MERTSVDFGLSPWFDSQAKWLEAFGKDDRYANRWHFEQALLKLSANDLWNGWCGLCEREVNFRLPSIEAGAATNLREELVCESCGMNARVRAALLLAKDRMDLRSADFYVTEQGSLTYLWMQKNIFNAIGSEFIVEPGKRAEMDRYLQDLGIKGGVRFEDVTCLGFEAATLDGIASFDVLEHVPDYQRALSEFARVLRPGGVLVLTAPFLSDQAETLVRATFNRNGEVIHLLEPEYHGDPAEKAGILCYYHFGWDLLDAARSAGFVGASMALPWNPGAGLMGWLWTLVATR